MIISVASGKGGTGKTLISTSLALSLKDDYDVTLADCDVEEPNGHLYFKGSEDAKRTTVSRKFPVIDDGKCTSCRVCVDFCRFNALAMAGETRPGRLDQFPFRPPLPLGFLVARIARVVVAEVVTGHRDGPTRPQG